MAWDALRGQDTLSMNVKGCYVVGLLFFGFFFSDIQPPTIALGVGQSIPNEPRPSTLWVSNILACFAELFVEGACLVRAPSLLGCCRHAEAF